MEAGLLGFGGESMLEAVLRSVCSATERVWHIVMAVDWIRRKLSMKTKKIGGKTYI